MGDVLDEDDYIKEKIEENEHSEWQQSDNEEGASSGGDLSEEEGDSDERKKEEKKLKRKQKFAVMKEKKRQKQESVDHDDNLDQSQLSADEMIGALLEHMPESFIATSKHSGNQFELSDFFSPVLPSATESLTKAPNPFIRALSVGLPNYKKLLLGNNSNNKKAPKDDNKASTLNSNDYGCPMVLIICASAVRATEIIKSISARLIKCKIGKLFAKHFKITEQIELLSKEIFPVCIGTPNRLNKLIEMGALHLSKLKVVLVDTTPDKKQFTVLSLTEVRNDMYELLYGSIFPERSHLKIALVKDSSSGEDGDEGEEGKEKKEKRKPNFHKNRESKKKDNSSRKGIINQNSSSSK
jgi:hypothetical protein